MIEVIVDADEEPFKPPQQIETAVEIACSVAGFTATEPELCIRFSGDAEICALNHQWRNKDAVTDVLSFPMQDAPVDVSEFLGDIALAVPFVRQEADRLGLDLDAHILHLIIHATLHLLGFDHIDDADAARMQALEIQAMQQMGLHHPYPAENMPVAQS